MKFQSILALSSIGLALAQDFEGYSCNPSTCKLPSCKCATRDPPVSNPPQFLLLTFDDSIQANIFALANNLFQNRKNPNGCSAKATFYTQVLESDPYLVNQWFARGNEVADHSVTHGLPSTHSFEEIEGMRAWAASLTGVNRGKIGGLRFPFLNYSAEALTLLSQMGFNYDTSMAAYQNERVWPYTL